MIPSQVIGAPAAVPVMEDDDLDACQACPARFAGPFPRFMSGTPRKFTVICCSVWAMWNDAQDLTSQTFLAAMESLPKYRGQSQFVAWLLGIARHKTADQFRRRKPEVEIEDAETVSR